MFDKLTAERIEAVNQRGAKLQQEINAALKDFVPTGRFRSAMPRFEEIVSFRSYDGALEEAQDLADRMARDIYEVRVHEVIGSGQRFVCSVRNYIGGRT